MVIRPLSPLSSGRAIFGLSPLLDLHRDMNRLFEGAFRDADNQGGASAFTPPLDVWETPTEMRFSLDVPGVTQDSVNLRVEGDVLAVSGERKASQRQEGEIWHISERPSGSFERSVKLPLTPDPDRISAYFADGVLSISVSKSALQEKGRRIQINSGIPKEKVSPTLIEETAKAHSNAAIDRASKSSSESASA